MKKGGGALVKGRQLVITQDREMRWLCVFCRKEEILEKAEGDRGVAAGDVVEESREG